jgi:glycosyltransferase involved in cell wall biosynthesis
VSPEDAQGGGTGPIAIVAARNEADRIGAALAALLEAFPAVELWVADDASSDATRDIAMVGGARVVGRGRPHGKGANVTAAAEAMLSGGPAPDRVVLLCDADLGRSAARLGPLVHAVEQGRCELAIAAFTRRIGGGVGAALGFSRWTVRRLAGVELEAPLSGQRALRVSTLRELLPFAPGFGLETGMDVDAARAGVEILEVELDLEHRATGRTPAGFAHRARQLRDIVRVYGSRR